MKISTAVIPDLEKELERVFIHSNDPFIISAETKS
jgi:hypothetical protein